MGNKSKKTSIARRDTFKWTDRMDDFFIDALIDQQNLGRRVDNIFTTAAYDNMLRELREKVGMPFEKDHLKNRLKTLKNNFKECFDIFNGMNDFVWSPETKMWTAKPETWKAFVKVKPEAKKWMTSQIANYDKMLLLFAKDRAKANGADITEEKPSQWVNSGSGPFLDGIDLQNELTLNIEDLNKMNNGANQFATPQQQQQQQSNPVEENSEADSEPQRLHAILLNGKKRKASALNVLERELKSIGKAIKDVAEAIREGNLIAERGRPHVYSEQEVFEELVKIGVETHYRYKAYTFLVANAGRVRAFFGCPAEERKEFLLHIMCSPGDS